MFNVDVFESLSIALKLSGICMFLLFVKVGFDYLKIFIKEFFDRFFLSNNHYERNKTNQEYISFLVYFISLMIN
ncbi:hypothetical protein E8M24_31495 [Bacillus thuringiensis]|uniref:hypothetical protein n=1 Tax=Bacillus thuringiensis TaxID=1428 RepID=UPI00125F2FAC|nr:hypothetical protein [Bacillus thuringiensis]KAB5626790.1 hypothetical protein E8M24_31495 [Bacillus thuringiensis]HDR5272027.1 hypothetical protein [Bacillus thuringiensis]